MEKNFSYEIINMQNFVKLTVNLPFRNSKLSALIYLNIYPAQCPDLFENLAIY